jgi:hypothetical protein
VWVAVVANLHIPLIESLSQSLMRHISAPRYMLSGMVGSSFVR